MTIKRLIKSFVQLGFPDDVIDNLARLLSSDSRGIMRRALSGRNYNPSIAISTQELQERTHKGRLSLISGFKDNAISVGLSIIAWIASYIMLTTTGAFGAIGVAIIGFPILHLIIWRLNSIYKAADSGSDQKNPTAAKFDGVAIAKSASKILWTLMCINVFAAMYYISDRCIESQATCGGRKKMACVQHGLPQATYACIGGAVICDYSTPFARLFDDIEPGPLIEFDPSKPNAFLGRGTCSQRPDAGQAICLDEEPPYAKTDKGIFAKSLVNQVDAVCKQNSCTHSPGSDAKLAKIKANIPQREHFVGLTDDAHQCVQDKDKLLQPFETPVYHYAYALTGRETTIKNLFRAQNRILPSANRSHGIKYMSLVANSYTCKDETRRSSSVEIDPEQSSEELLKQPQLAIFTPSDVGNHLFCYQQNGQWKSLNNTWVIVGEEATCSDPDCQAADFTDGLGYHFSDALYYSLIVQSTIGYGDILPLSDRARMMTGLQALCMMFIGLT